MPDRPARLWHDLRRSVAIAGIGFWILLGALPLIVLGTWWARGDTFDASAPRILVQFVLPALVQTASLACAIAVLRADSPQRSRRPARWQVGLFLLGLALYLGATAAYL
jgi:hypothetical protein